VEWFFFILDQREVLWGNVSEKLKTPPLLPSLGAVWMLCFRKLKMQENAVYRYLARFGQAVFETG
jgi:hypothetical protein